MPKPIKKINKFPASIKQKPGFRSPEYPDKEISGAITYVEQQKKDYLDALAYVEEDLLKDDKLSKLSEDTIISHIKNLHVILARTVYMHPCSAIAKENKKPGEYRDRIVLSTKKQIPAQALDLNSQQHLEAIFSVLRPVGNNNHAAAYIKWFFKLHRDHAKIEVIDGWIENILCAFYRNPYGAHAPSYPKICEEIIENWREVFFNGLKLKDWREQYFRAEGSAFDKMPKGAAELFERATQEGLYTDEEAEARDMIMNFFTHPKKIEESMRSFAKKLKEMLQSETEDPIQIACFVYHEINSMIRPFLEYNDCLARVFSNAVLMYHGYPPCFTEENASDLHKLEHCFQIKEYISLKILEEFKSDLKKAAEEGDLISLFQQLAMTSIFYRTTNFTPKKIRFAVVGNIQIALDAACLNNQIPAARMLLDHAPDDPGERLFNLTHPLSLCKNEEDVENLMLTKQMKPRFKFMYEPYHTFLLAVQSIEMMLRFLYTKAPGRENNSIFDICFEYYHEPKRDENSLYLENYLYRLNSKQPEMPKVWAVRDKQGKIDYLNTFQRHKDHAFFKQNNQSIFRDGTVSSSFLKCFPVASKVRNEFIEGFRKLAPAKRDEIINQVHAQEIEAKENEHNLTEAAQLALAMMEALYHGRETDGGYSAIMELLIQKERQASKRDLPKIIFTMDKNKSNNLLPKSENDSNTNEIKSNFDYSQTPFSISGRIPWGAVIRTSVPMNLIKNENAKRHENDERSPLDVILNRCMNFKYVTDTPLEGEEFQQRNYWGRRRIFRSGQRFVYSYGERTSVVVNSEIRQKRYDRNVSLTEGMANAMMLLTKLSDWEGIDIILSDLKLFKFEGLGNIEHSKWLDELKANIAREVFKQFKKSGIGLLEDFFTPLDGHQMGNHQRFVPRDLLKIIMAYAMPNSMPFLELINHGNQSKWETKTDLTWQWPHQYIKMKTIIQEELEKQEKPEEPEKPENSIRTRDGQNVAP